MNGAVSQKRFRHQIKPPIPAHITEHSIERKREFVLDALRDFGPRRLASLRAPNDTISIKHVEPTTLREMTTNLTILQVAVKALQEEAGVSTARTIGAVMDHLNLTQGQVYAAFCLHLVGNLISGEMAATRLAQAMANDSLQG